MSSTKKVPALVIAGFLGAGKTTLVRHLLDQARADGTKIAVITNEFGKLGIDKALLGSGAESYVELEGGCVCCMLSDELVDTLEMLRRDIDPDRIVVETSGVALPYDTLLNFWRDPVRAWIEDDAAVVVVDALQVRDARDLDGTFEDQVASADLLLINKTDLVSPQDIEAIESVLREIEPDAPILHASHGIVDQAVLFPPDPTGRRAARRSTGALPTPHSHEEFEVEEIRIDEGVDLQRLEKQLVELGALRIKGFIRSKSGLKVVQGVGRRIDIHDVNAAPEEAIGRLVIIRRGEATTRHQH